MRTTRLITVALAFGALAPQAAAAQGTSPSLDSATLAGFRWRSIGPANMAGRVSDVEGIPSPSRTFYVAAAAGGIWKTTNAGTTFRPIFDVGRVISMGDLAIAPSDTNQVWAGTGEEDSRNSISPGGGIYKSTDGGMTWKLMGLEKTEHIGRIVVHPTNPGTVWVAALGAAWRANPDRGLYKTTDGGQSWRKVLSVSDKAGAVDVAIDPRDPNVLWASTWERVRGPYFLKSGGPGSALWKSTDGGETWNKVTGNGLPTTTLGRISIAIAPSNPDYIYLMVEADSNPNPKPVKGTKAQQLQNGLYRSTDGGKRWEKRASNNVRPFYYSQVRVDPKNPERVYWSSTPVNFSNDGGKTVMNATQGIHVDHHAMWIDPNDPAHFVVGNDGGVAQTWDKGGNYDFINTFAIGQFYNVSYDMAIPYTVCGGLQDNGSWCGPSRRRGPIYNAFWATVSGGDGFHTAQDPTDPAIVYAESQGGNMSRVNVVTGERTSLQKPSWLARYRLLEDSILIARGDTLQPAPKDVQRRVDALRARQRADSTDMDIRWNWNTPFFLSPHNPSVFYAAANKVFKSLERGENLRPISPDLSRKLMAKIDTSIRKTGGITLDATGAETYGTVVSLAESPLRPGILFAGTDDGNLWITRNDGATWDQLKGPFPGLPDDMVYVSRIEPSRFDSATVYVTFDNHRRGDFTPYVYASTDWGRSWRSIAANLPTGGPDFVHVIREDPVNRDLLYVGTDVGVYVSLDRGASWQRFMAGLPTVPVHDLKIHPRDRELIAGTHGRAIWIVDVAPLQQMTRAVASEKAHLFEPKVAYQYGNPPALGESPGHKVFEAQSPAYGAEIAYRLATGVQGQARITITDAAGDTVRSLTGPARAGINRVTWDFRGRPAPRPALTPSGIRDSVNMMRRMDAVIDSLVGTGMNRQMLEGMRRRLLSGEGGFGFGGGGRGQRAEGWVERPGESRGSARGQGGGGEGATEGGELSQESQGEIMRLLIPRTPGGGFGGGLFGRGRGGNVVASGDYLVTVEVGGQKLRQTLRVERTATADAGGSFGFEEDDEEHEP
ncbi:MAG TPA: hypothetical protein VGD77_01075 [Gemmatimonadaceae bacterium]